LRGCTAPQAVAEEVRDLQDQVQERAGSARSDSPDIGGIVPADIER
jgi:hypothetical protein